MSSTLVIGFGAVGRAVTNRLIEQRSSAQKAGVTVMARSDRQVPAGADLFVGDASSSTDLHRALDVSGADRIICCAHAAYTEAAWRSQLIPLERAVLNAAAEVGAEVSAEVGAHVTFAESVYAFGPGVHTVTAESRVAATVGKPGVRAELLAARDAAAAPTASVVASDLYGPGCGESMVAHALIIDRVHKGKRPLALVDADTPHAFTYIDDYARALVDASAGRATGIVLTPTAEPITQRDFATLAAEAFNAEHHRPLTLRPWMLRVAGIADENVGGLREMTWLWDSPRALESDLDWAPTPYRDGLASLARS
ncbi:NAD-dependent epimerase/dehydratase family protein [Corynebacterium glaucum]|uniref:NAD-dependent epimerase/dehydratase family protein n=1 Tax=Corynebacterium glaucum TaxID=187491 RepID=UPI0026583D32|nr:NAD-dependent epimerase/dehydratase family protein [Corynebacterium glaucum]